MSDIDLRDLFDYEDDETTAQAAAVTSRSKRELQGFQKDIDVRKLVLDVSGKGKEDLRIEDSIVSGEVVRTILGASQVNITVHDHARRILKSKNLTDDKGELRAVDIRLDGLHFRLVKIEKQGDDLMMTFEDVDVARLRAKKGPRLLGTRGKITRAQAILLLVRSVKIHRIPVHINELNKKQPIEDAKKVDKEAIRDRKRSKGFDRGTILDGKQGPLNKTQLDNAATGLAVCEQLHAPDRATLAWIEAAIVEGPDFQNPSGGDGTSVGILQLTDAHFGGSVAKRRDITLVTTRFMSGPSFTGAEGGAGAIELSRKHPDWTPGQIAQTIQGSAYPDRYDGVRKQASLILDEWGHTGGSLSRGQIFKKYHFRVNKRETYWDAIQRLAQEVEWRAFMTGGEFYYISEDDLYKSRSRFTVQEFEDGVFNIDGSQDYRRTSGRISITCRINRWRVPPGTICTVVGLGSMNGKYLVETVTRQLYTADAIIDAKKPTAERDEPRPEVRAQGQGAVAGEVPEVHIDGGAKSIVDQAARIAISNGGVGVYVGSDFRVNSLTSSGNVSDHASNNAQRAARDIGVRGIDLLTGPPSPKLDRAIVALGRAFDRGYKPRTTIIDTFDWRGFQIQVIWRTPLYGGHMGHIHFGAHRATSPAPGYSKVGHTG